MEGLWVWAQAAVKVVDSLLCSQTSPTCPIEYQLEACGEREVCHISNGKQIALRANTNLSMGETQISNGPHGYHRAWRQPRVRAFVPGKFIPVLGLIARDPILWTRSLRPTSLIHY